MGLYSTLAILDAAKQQRLTPGNAVVEAAIAAVYSQPPANWVLDLGKQGDAVDAVLQVQASGPAKEAVWGCQTGREVGEDMGYGYPRYLMPETVEAIAADLAALPDHLLPQPDPEGYGIDPRVNSDAAIAAITKGLARFSLDPSSAEDMGEMAADLERLKQHYERAAAQQGGMLLFIR